RAGQAGDVGQLVGRVGARRSVEVDLDAANEHVVDPLDRSAGQVAGADQAVLGRLEAVPGVHDAAVTLVLAVVVAQPAHGDAVVRRGRAEGHRRGHGRGTRD